MVSSLVLITGGAGFIGANLINYLLKKDRYHIRIFDNLSIGRKDYIEQILNSLNLARSKNPVEFIEADIRNTKQVEEAVEGVDTVVHLAAQTSVVDSLKNPEENFEINAKGTLNLLEACRKRGIERFIYASSNAVVGEQAPPIDEKKVPMPLSPYGASKLAGEALCSTYYHSFGIKAVSLRFANVYGPYSEHKTSVVTRFIQRAKEGMPLVIYGDGEQTRDFIHAKDISSAIELTMSYELSIRSQVLIFQIANGMETRIIYLANMIRKLAVASGGEDPNIIFESSRKGEIRKNYSDITKAKDILRFRPKIGLEEGLRDLWER
jgi:UDP-glucose 4-epimerase